MARRWINPPVVRYSKKSIKQTGARVKAYAQDTRRAACHAAVTCTPVGCIGAVGVVELTDPDDVPNDARGLVTMQLPSTI